MILHVAMTESHDLQQYVPESCQPLLSQSNQELRSTIPELARDQERMVDVEQALSDIPTTHHQHQADARDLSMLDNESLELAVTSPPYFDLKEYADESVGQLGSRKDYSEFLDELSDVWKECYKKLVPGGRLCIVVGDVLRSRSEHGRHRILPLHSHIQQDCLDVGFDALAPIIWYKVGNATLESGGNARFLGKPYEPSAVIKNDIEYILLLRKPGGYRSPSTAARILSTIERERHREYFTQLWGSISGEQSGDHPAPYPVELAERLIRMFSFTGDTVLDPFAGSGSTAIAAAQTGRDSVNIELESEYIDIMHHRLQTLQNTTTGTVTVEYQG